MKEETMTIEEFDRKIEEFDRKIEKAWYDYYKYFHEVFCGPPSNGCDYELDEVEESYLVNLCKIAQNLEEVFKNIFGISYKEYKENMECCNYSKEELKKKKYMTAEEAYKLTNDTIDLEKEKQINKIIQKINNAARNGEFGVSIDYEISKPVIDELKKLGYNIVNNTSQKKGFNFKITWYDPKYNE